MWTGVLLVKCLVIRSAHSRGYIFEAIITSVIIAVKLAANHVITLTGQELTISFNNMLTYQDRKSGRGLAKPLACPEVTTFAELFPKSAKYEHFKTQFTKQNARNGARVGNYCARMGGPSLDVECAGFVIEEIGKRTISIANDELYFQLVDHHNGWTLVVVNYNQIIGNFYLAYIKTDSIPKL